MKKGYICPKINNTLNFLPSKVNFCCSYSEGPHYKITDTIDLKEILNTQKHFLKTLKSGIIPKDCSDCIFYTEKMFRNFYDYLFSKDYKINIKNIIVNHFKQCDCSCVYCSSKLWWKGHRQNYDLLPIIKNLYKGKIISEDLCVEFQGGCVSLLDEFEPLMEEFLSHNCKKFNIFTNGIKYLPIIEKASKTSVITFSISLDSGTKETFQKIKGVDAFDSVFENTDKFARLPNVIMHIKYILLNGLNDNEEELNNFLNTVSRYRWIKDIGFDIDYRDMIYDKDFKLPEHYLKLIDIAQDFCTRHNIYFYILDYAKLFVEKSRSET